MTGRQWHVMLEQVIGIGGQLGGVFRLLSERQRRLLLLLLMQVTRIEMMVLVILLRHRAGGGTRVQLH